MANPLDQVTRDLLHDDEGRPLRRVYITGPEAPVDNSETDVINRFERMVAPEPQGHDVLKLIQQVKDYLANAGTGILDQVGVAGVQPGPVRDAAVTGRNSLVGLAGPENDLWPVRMIKSGATLPGEVSQGIVPVVDPETGRTSVPMIERAQDTAGLAGGGALTVKPGSATLGSGPIRQGAGALYKVEKSEAGNLQLYGTPGKDARVMDPMTGEVKFQATGPGSWEQGQAFWRKNSKPSWDVVTGDTTGHYEPVMSFPSKKAAEDWVAANKNKPLAPGGTTLMSDTQKPGAAISGAASSPAPVFYSVLEHAVQNAAQDAMLPQQWLGPRVERKYIDNNKQSKTYGQELTEIKYGGALGNVPGITPAEIEWTGLGGWLAQQKGKVSKEDVKAYLDEHKIGIKDVTKREYDLGDNPNDHALEQAEAGGTRYSNYQLPGGENYREHLLTLPDKSRPPTFEEWWKRTKVSDLDALTKSDHPADKGALERFRKDYEVEKDRMPREGGYKSSHWDEPNVLAHVRTNERDVGGQPSLHIEEIQSDWHQQGRKQGYRIDDTGAKALLEKSGIPDKGAVTSQAVRQAEKEGKLTDQEASALHTWAHPGPWGVPDAPFKTSWPELALKRMIRLAAEEGKTRISWTPGEAQAARYDLSKSIDTLSWDPASGQLKGFKGKDSVVSRKATAEELPDIVGKEAADRLLKSELRPVGLKDTPHHVLEGQELKVGGEGMKGFYDNMLPKMVEKLGKAHGVKVQKGNIPGDAGMASTPEAVAIRTRMTTNNREALKLSQQIQKDMVDGRDTSGAMVKLTELNHKRAADEKALSALVEQPVYYFDIPPAWRDQAVGKGFPLYMQGIPFPLTPVDYDPFKKEK